MSLGATVLMVLLLMLIGVVRSWPHGSSWDHRPKDIPGMLLVVVVVLLLMSRP